MTDAEECAQQIVTSVGKKINPGLPLGLGKANLLFNAIYSMAAKNPSISLRVFTALTLGRPVAKPPR
jgi:hypothetical protein